MVTSYTLNCSQKKKLTILWKSSDKQTQLKTCMPHMIGLAVHYSQKD